MNTPEVHAYIAGIIDGEAYVGIKKSTWAMRNRPDVHCPSYSERIQIRMKCKPILELIKNTFGGSVYTEPKIYQSANGFTTNSIMSVYSATNRVAANIIKAIRPYLIEKANQADAILKLRKQKESPESRKVGSPAKRVLKPEILAEREELYQYIKSLHRG